MQLHIFVSNRASRSAKFGRGAINGIMDQYWSMANVGNHADFDDEGMEKLQAEEEVVDDFTESMKSSSIISLGNVSQSGIVGSLMTCAARELPVVGEKSHRMNELIIISITGHCISIVHRRQFNVVRRARIRRTIEKELFDVLRCA